MCVRVMFRCLKKRVGRPTDRPRDSEIHPPQNINTHPACLPAWSPAPFDTHNTHPTPHSPCSSSGVGTNGGAAPAASPPSPPAPPPSTAAAVDDDDDGGASAIPCLPCRSIDRIVTQVSIKVYGDVMGHRRRRCFSCVPTQHTASIRFTDSPDTRSIRPTVAVPVCCDRFQIVVVGGAWCVNSCSWDACARRRESYRLQLPLVSRCRCR